MGLVHEEGGEKPPLQRNLSVRDDLFGVMALIAVHEPKVIPHLKDL